MSLPSVSVALALGFGVLLGASAASAEGTFSSTSLTPDTAVQLAQAALKSCRDQGYQVAVSVVDRGGNIQALIRDRFAGPHTPDTATGKAWTAVSFRANTTTLAANTASGSQSGARDVPGALMLGGGVIIEAGGSIVGGVGVSGAPGGELDEACAKVGIDAIAGDLM